MGRNRTAMALALSSFIFTHSSIMVMEALVHMKITLLLLKMWVFLFLAG
jgi:hypothetical protein